MYDLNNSSSRRAARQGQAALLIAALMAVATSSASGQSLLGESVVRKIEGSSDKLEITTNTSRILTLEKKIPKVQVNNPELLAVTPLSATEIQVAAKKAGVTQVNLWDEDGQIHTVDVYIYGDVRELEHALATQFPNSAVRVYRYSQSLVLTGFIDRPDYVDPIRQLAEDYAPKVINNISVGGVQQVLLKVKIYEVSRTKLRQLGVDVGAIGGHGYVGTSVSGLINNVGSAGNPFGIVQTANAVKGITDTAGQTVEFAVTNGNDAFLGFVDALQERNAARILAEPNIVAVSGRPSVFRVGGEIPIPVPQGLGNIAIEYKPFGTQVDFLPIVLGNGKIRLEVRPHISELDFANALVLNNTQVPALADRMADTAVEMNAGQTFAIAGLIQQRIQTQVRGVPLLSDIPILGVPFRRTADDAEEVELLILVTPELVDAMEPHQVPPCGPGMGTITPSDCDLYIDGKIEVANPCSACANGACGTGACGECARCSVGGFPSPPEQFINGSGGVGGVGVPTMAAPQGYETLPAPVPGMQDGTSVEESQPSGEAPGGPTFANNASDASHFRPTTSQPLVRQATRPYRVTPTAAGGSGLIGPVGYDAE